MNKNLIYEYIGLIIGVIFLFAAFNRQWITLSA